MLKGKLFLELDVTVNPENGSVNVLHVNANFAADQVSDRITEQLIIGPGDAQYYLLRFNRYSEIAKRILPNTEYQVIYEGKKYTGRSHSVQKGRLQGLSKLFKEHLGRNNGQQVWDFMAIDATLETATNTIYLDNYRTHNQ